MAISCGKVIENFIAGVKEGEEGSISSSYTVKIIGNQLFHYSTPIIERYRNNFILNISRYSTVTEQLQKRIKNMLPRGYKTVDHVVKDYQGSLKDYLNHW